MEEVKNSTMTTEEKKEETVSGEAVAAVEKKKKKSWIPWVLLAFSILVLAGAYLGGAYYYQTRFFHGTSINGVALDGMDAQTAEGALKRGYGEYSLQVLDRDGAEAASLSAWEIDLTIEPGETVRQALAAQNAYLWILQWLSEERREIPFEIVYDEEKARELMAQWPVFDTRKMKAPVNARIGEYSEAAGGYEIIPEDNGTKLNEKKAMERILSALYEREAQVGLEDLYETAQITSEDARLLKTLEQLNKIVNTRIVYDWNGSEVVVDNSQIKDWIRMDGNLPRIDTEQVAEFVKEQSIANDTFGTKRSFTTAQGTNITIANVRYGWRTDRDKETETLVGLLENGESAEREPEYIYKGYVKGQNDVGNSYVEIDLTNQHLYLWIKGKVELETDFVSGNVSAGNTTPGGLFGLTYKTRDAVLRGRDYATPVKYWMPFNGNIGMHDANWRGSFGGNIYLTSGSHGCINLPPSKAAEIYEYMETGFPVVCYYFETPVVENPPEEDLTPNENIPVEQEEEEQEQSA